MSATEKLRRMLDERGIVYISDDANNTIFYINNERYVYYIEPESQLAKVFGYGIDPEQVIAATVERGTCRMVLRHDYEVYGESPYIWWECDECGWTPPYPFCMPEVNYCPNCGRKVVE